MKNDHKSNLEARALRVDILKKIQDTKYDRVKYDQEEQKRELDMQELQAKIDALKPKSSSIFEMLMCASACVLDDEKSAGMPGSEPRFKSLFDESEVKEIKKEIIKRIKKS